ncbi:MAG: helix-turn-helix transcriptional regulator [Hespellia sp.]|nr:helix-turn-helix transcriptional regulator [Hespellia sp.]
MAIDKSLVSGSTSMLILRLLSEKDMYGYEMIEMLDERSQNVFQLKAGTLYPLLHTLENQKLLTSYEDMANGRTRKYYSITAEGKKHLRVKKSEWQEYSEAVARVLNLTGMAEEVLDGEISGLEV